MATIKANYDAMQQTSNELSNESKRIFRLALDIERIMTKIPMKCTSQSLAKLKMARQCIGLTTVSAKLMKFAVNLEEIKNSYKDADHRVLVSGSDSDYAKYLNDNAQGELSKDDVRRIKKAMDELDETKIHSGMTDDEMEKIKLYNSMFEKAYPKEAERINKLAESYKGNHFNERKDLVKYFLYKNSFNSDKFDDEQIKNIFSHANEVPSSLFTRFCEAIDNDKSYGKVKSIDAMKNDYTFFRQGNACIYNFDSHKNSDGSTNISFTMSNNQKTYTEVTVYNANGEIQERVYMNGQRDASSIPEVFSDAGKGIKDIVTGKFARYDGDFSNAKKDFDFKVPKGGYIQITDDPDAMNYSTYAKQKFKDIAATGSGMYVDSFNIKSDNAVVEVGFDVVKGMTSTGIKDTINGTSTPIGDYAKDGTWTVTEAILTAGKGNPAAIGFEGINTTLKVNTLAEKYVVDVQQEKCKGNNSLYIYN